MCVFLPHVQYYKLMAIRLKFTTRLVSSRVRGSREIFLHPCESGDDWTPCFTLKNVSLPEVPFLGFSALTGDVSDEHEYVIATSMKPFRVDSIHRLLHQASSASRPTLPFSPTQIIPVERYNSRDPLTQGGSGPSRRSFSSSAPSQVFFMDTKLTH